MHAYDRYTTARYKIIFRWITQAKACPETYDRYLPAIGCALGAGRRVHSPKININYLTIIQKLTFFGQKKKQRPRETLFENLLMIADTKVRLVWNRFQTTSPEGNAWLSILPSKSVMTHLLIRVTAMVELRHGTFATNSRLRLRKLGFVR